MANDSSSTQITSSCSRTPPDENATLTKRFVNRIHEFTQASMKEHTVCLQEFFRVKIEKTSDCWNKMIEKIPGVGTQSVNEGKNAATIETSTGN